MAEIRRLQDHQHRELTAIRDRLVRLELAVLALAREMGTHRLRLDHSGPDSPAGGGP